MSLTTLPYAAAPAASAFNSDFYATVAAVIPTLFISINLQPVFRATLAADQRRRRSVLAGGRGHLWYAPAWFLAAIQFLFWLGVGAELVALHALAVKSGSNYIAMGLQVIVVLLAFVSTFGLLLQYLLPAEGTATGDPRPEEPGE